MKQHRNTKQRQLVLEAVRSRKDHPTADQIYQDLKMIDDKISRATVYRNLNYLAEAGEILHVKVPSADRYDWRLDFHYHLFCTGCEAVSDLPLVYNQKLDQEVTEKTSYVIERHRTVFEGICPACQARKKKGSV
ncbi:MAG: transcriptional repressor [Hespellia sp.]|nr:transcriptional repressor [Hespellia sp.]